MKLEELEQTKDENQLNPFYVSFADLMVLLSVFFVMIISISKVELGAFEKIKTGFSGDTKGTLVELAKNLQKIAKKHSGVSIQLDNDGVRLDLESKILFQTGSAALKAKNLNSFAPILLEILKTKYKLDIEGHTDDVPLFKRISKNEVETNWSLSGRRASSFINYLRKFGFSEKRLRIIGYGPTKPRVKLKNKKGKSLQRARSKNRRVSILVR